MAHQHRAPEQKRWTPDLPPHLAEAAFYFPTFKMGGHQAVSHYFSDKFRIVSVGWDPGPEHEKQNQVQVNVMQ